MIKAFNKVYPNVHVKYKPVGNNLPTVLATAVAGGNPPDMADIAQPGYVAAARAAGQAEADHVREVGDRRRTSRRRGSSSARSTASCTRSSSRRPTSRLVWYNVPAFKAAGVTPPKTWAQLLTDAKTLKASRHAGVLDRRRRRLDAHRPVREHLPPHVRAGEVRRADRAQDQVDRPVGEDGADDDGARSSATRRTSPAARAARSSTGFNDSVTNAFGVAAEGGDGVRGRLRRAASSLVDEGEGRRPASTCSPFPSITPGADASARRDRRRPVRHVPRHPGDRGVREVPRDRAGRRGWAKQGGFATGNKNVPASVYPDAITKATEAADRHGEVGRVRHVRRAAGRRSARRRARASGGSSRTS